MNELDIEKFLKEFKIVKESTKDSSYEEVIQNLEIFDKNTNLKKSFETICIFLEDLEVELEKGNTNIVKQNIGRIVGLIKTYFEEYSETLESSSYINTVNLNLIRSLTYIIHAYILGCSVKEYKEILNYEEDKWYNNGRE